VEDSGPGIDPAAVDDIFRHGFSTKEPGPFGRGLGLALVRQAVHRLGGTLTISSPAGALFHVTLPTAAVSALPAATLPATPLPAASGQAAEGQP
jgi:sensor histidine kinase regulating citrate/malate metabolism